MVCKLQLAALSGLLLENMSRTRPMAALSNASLMWTACHQARFAAKMQSTARNHLAHKIARHNLSSGGCHARTI